MFLVVLAMNTLAGAVGGTGMQCLNRARKLHAWIPASQLAAQHEASEQGLSYL